MAALVSAFIAITLSLLITRIATEALTFTGLSRASAKFQARSAFTGTGFTTAESASVVEHPVRRRIIMWLMLLGNAGVITVMSSLILTFVSSGSLGDGVSRFAILTLGLALIWGLGTNRAFNRVLTRWVRWSLRRWIRLDIHDYASLLHLRDEYQVMEIAVDEDNWIAHKTLQESKLRDEGLVVLGIERDDQSYVGAPNGQTYVCPGDLLILYGRRTALMELDLRREGWAGEQAHHQAIAVQRRLETAQEAQDPYVSKELSRDLSQSTSKS
ncbi:TrkA C-terminal domain-containing protein [Lyngbya confervoides]|uniref:TrkA C-terminal domain-containing protein n=1 Tax=Lyngbya confervoides BDU141951 TaxID=1574623 RepID=A0ABD4T1W3_9CYAN|nr:TrkA C-terminal domain-containing protein [Lyngbya confervoides]MCM1982423.1 TrkA C-terminal domain-containing protein [Lyngbya confervoides BDU141951]